MKLSRLFGKSFARTSLDKKSTMKPSQQKDSEMTTLSASSTSSGGICSVSTTGIEVIDWELRPGGMVVQRRDSSTIHSPSSGPLIKVKVSHGLNQHDITIPAQATFGDLKWLMAQETGLQPHEQRLLFCGKEKDDNEFLHISGVKDMAKIILVEDPASKEKKLKEMKIMTNVSKACQLVPQVQLEVDKLAERVVALDGVVSSGGKVANFDLHVLSESLVKILIRLDNIEAEGEAEVQRRIEVRRVQSYVDQVDNLRVCNGNPICSNAKVVITTQWETFDSDVGTLTAPPPDSGFTTQWELFD